MEGKLRVLQPDGWARPRGFSHGLVLPGNGNWIVLAGQTGAGPDGEYEVGNLAGQLRVALERVVLLLREGGAKPEHIVRLIWYLTSRSDYESSGPGIAAAWRDTLGRAYPPSTLLYVSGLVDPRALVEFDVTAFVPHDAATHGI
jgi:enamine deaminase RidA (YjgF/YER057c/UK114 family)